jgi:hypothetical protein
MIGMGGPLELLEVGSSCCCEGGAMGGMLVVELVAAQRISFSLEMKASCKSDVLTGQSVKGFELKVIIVIV